MDEASLASIDSHVIDPALRAAEEHEVPELQIVPRHPFGRFTLVCGGPRHLLADLLEAVEDEPAAIETLPRRVAAVAVGRTQEARRDADQQQFAAL